MTTAREVFLHLDGTQLEAFVPGLFFYSEDAGRYVKGDGTVENDLGTFRFVEQWNEFNEGNEDIYIITELNGELFRLEIYNDSWGADGGWQLTNVNKVEKQQVMKTVYVEI